MSRMVETCQDCGKTWGVTMTPREDIRCTECGRSRPWRNPALYWWLRAWTGWPSVPFRSPGWWDQQCSLRDLKYAAQVAAEGHGRDEMREAA